MSHTSWSLRLNLFNFIGRICRFVAHNNSEEIWKPDKYNYIYTYAHGQNNNRTFWGRWPWNILRLTVGPQNDNYSKANTVL